MDEEATRRKWRLHEAILKEDLDSFQELLGADRKSVPQFGGAYTWLGVAAGAGALKSLKALLDAGHPVNEGAPTGGDTPLYHAIREGHYDAAKLLIMRGADLIECRPVISAMDIQDKSQRRALVELLVDNGLDLNVIYDVFGDMQHGYTALDWAKKADPEIAAYLRAKGAKTANEVRALQGQVSSTTSSAVAAPTSEVVAFFTAEFGPVDSAAQIEIVPSTDRPIAIHSVPPSGRQKSLTLFTSGLSEGPLKTPAGKENFSRAELFIELPGAWPHRNMGTPNHSWPTRWLRRMAQHAAQTGKWLGGPLAVISNGQPPAPIAPGLKFVAFLLMAEKSFTRQDSQTVQLLRLTPLYPEELKLQATQGFPTLMRAFDKYSVPLVVDLDRVNAATGR